MAGNGKRGLWASIILALDPRAKQQLKDEAAEALGDAGKRGSAEFDKAMQEGGRKAVRALSKTLKDEYDKTLSKAQVQLARGIIDKEAFDKTEREAKRTFNGTLLPLMDKLQAEGKVTEAQFGQLARQIKRVGDAGQQAGRSGGGFMAGVGKITGGIVAADLIRDAGRAMVRFGVDSVHAANESEDVFGRLGGTLRRVGVDINDVRGELDAMGEKMMDTTTFGDEDAFKALDAMVTQSRNYAASLAKMPLVADLAAKKDIELATAGELVGKAMAGKRTQLEKMFPALKGSTDLWGDLAKIVGGAAAEAAGTAAGQYKQLTEEVGEFQEGLGDILTSGTESTSVISEMRGAVRSLTEGLTENREEAVFWTRALVGSLRVVWNLLILLPRLFFNVLQTAATGIYTLVQGVELAFHMTVHRIKTNLNRLIEGINQIPGIEIGFRFDTSRLAGELAEARRQFAFAKREFVRDGLDIGEAFKDVGRSVMQLGSAFDPVAPPRRATSDGGGGDLSDKEVDPRDAERAREKAEREREARFRDVERRMNDRISVMQKGGQTPGASTTPGIISKNPLAGSVIDLDAMAEKAQSTALTVLSVFDVAARGAVEASGSISESWSETFDLMFSGALSLRGLLDGLWDGYVLGLGKAIAGEAKMMGARAATKAIGAAAEGLWLASRHDYKGSAQAFGSVPKYLAEAAGWSALGGIASAAASAAAGGSGVAGSSTRDQGLSTARDAERQPIQVIVNMDPFDPRKGAHAKVIGQAARLDLQLNGVWQELRD
jgi:hypothetical protein